MNIYDIARKAGVSIATVSRVLNGSGTVRESTARKVLDVMEAENYRPNAFARGLMLDSMKLIGVLCTDISDTFYAKAIGLLQHLLGQRGYNILLCCTGEDLENKKKQLGYLLEKHVDAVFLVGSAFRECSDNQHLQEAARQVPLFLLNGSIEIPGLYSIYCEEESAVAEAVTKLVCAGKRRILYLYDAATQSAMNKLSGYCLGLAQNGIDYEEALVVQVEKSLNGGYAATDLLLQADNAPDAVIASEDVIAVGALKAYQKRNLQCCVIGCNNSVLCECTTPSLTSIDNRLEKMCEEAVLMMDRVFAGEKPEASCAVQGKLEQRESFCAEKAPAGIIGAEFLLKGETARRLYHSYAEHQPIIDYHCHIDPREIAEDRRFDNITQMWLGGDHYKWRLIRSNGVDEDLITGDADDHTKFLQFAAMLPKAIGNPMYHWTHLELKKYFDYDGILNEDTAEEVWQLTQKKLREEGLSVRKIIEMSGVRVIGTTDDPADDLHWHEVIAADPDFATKVVPSFRPDKAVNVEKGGFREYICRLSAAAGMDISCVEDVKTALSRRLEWFCSHGCKASDHGLDYVVWQPDSEENVERTFRTVMEGGTVSQKDADAYKTAIMLHLGREYHRRGVVMQLHYGAIRNTNEKMFRRLGPDTGFDCLSTRACGEAIVGFLNALEAENSLPKTVLYSLNPGDNAMLDTIIGCFQGTETVGKIQHGAAWWFSDTKRGMEEQLRSLADLSILGNFIGMLTDSRSFLSYTRHDYFRRILCNLIGSWVDNGEYPRDEKALRQIVEGICFGNAERYFGF